MHKFYNIKAYMTDSNETRTISATVLTEEQAETLSNTLASNPRVWFVTVSVQTTTHTAFYILERIYGKVKRLRESIDKRDEPFSERELVAVYYSPAHNLKWQTL